MTKRELERALRLAARVARDNEFFLIGSQAVYGYCQRPPAGLEIHDLIVSKLAAGRLKDLEFVGALLHRRLADPKIIRRRIGRCRSLSLRERLHARLKAVVEDIRRHR